MHLHRCHRDNLHTGLLTTSTQPRKQRCRASGLTRTNTVCALHGDRHPLKSKQVLTIADDSLPGSMSICHTADPES